MSRLRNYAEMSCEASGHAALHQPYAIELKTDDQEAWKKIANSASIR